MEIAPSIIQLLANVNSAAARAVTALQVGQLLNVVVLDTPSANSATIAIAGQKLTAHTQTPLLSGQQVTARVERGGEQPVLRIIPATLDTASTVLNQALRNALPHQTPINQGLQTLTQQTQQSLSNLPGPVRHALEQISLSVSNPARLSEPGTLSTAVRDSGIFLEAHLKQLARSPSTVPTTATDTKARLLRLVEVLTKAVESRGPQTPATNTTAPSPRSNVNPSFGHLTSAGNIAARETGARINTGTPLSEVVLNGARESADRSASPVRSSETIEVLKQMLAVSKASLANVQTHQLQTVKSADGPQQVWELEIPVWVEQQVQALEVRIRREVLHTRQQPEFSWSIDVTIDLGSLGPLHARVALSQGNVGAVFWAEHESTSKLVATQLDNLKDRLEDAGLGVNQLSAHHGPAPVAKQHFEQMIAVRA